MRKRPAGADDRRAGEDAVLALFERIAGGGFGGHRRSLRCWQVGSKSSRAILTSSSA